MIIRGRITGFRGLKELKENTDMKEQEKK